MRGGQSQRHSGAHGKYSLHRRLAEARLAYEHDIGPLFQRRGQDFRRARRSLVDENRYGKAGERAAGRRFKGLVETSLFTSNLGNGSAGEEQIGRSDSLVEEPARIISEVQDQAAQIPAGVFSEPSKRPLDLTRGPFLKIHDSQIPDSVVQKTRLHRRDADDFSMKDEIPYASRFAGANPESDARARSAPDFGEHFHERYTLNALAVDSQDFVARPNTRFSSRRTVKGGDHHVSAVARADHQPETAEPTRRADAELLDHTRVHEARIGIEVVEEEIETAGHELVGGKSASLGNFRGAAVETLGRIIGTILEGDDAFNALGESAEGQLPHRIPEPS